MRYAYFAIVTDAHPRPEEPAVMCRRWVDDGGQVHDEVFTSDLMWSPSTALSSAETGSGEVHQVDVETAARFQKAVRERALQVVSSDEQYSYLAWVDQGSVPDDPTGLLRTWTTAQAFEREERYVAGSGWERSYVREDWQRGRHNGRFVQIDQATAEQIVQRWEQRRAEQG
ncbi:hypothetical protein ACSHWB_10050 [Lentzea sp. HUAS TT2]|uniref:hypothetical protein n=1 Tax=Lentzea sp. HUAS TT2 TaxID=3447454 RepID=UPI003F709561